MPLLNYTTTIEAIKTVSEIQKILAKHGAKAILTNYNDEGLIEALAFKVATPYGEIDIRLPVDPDAVLNVMTRQNLQGKIPKSFVNRPQAVRVAWRIVKDWVESQMAILETEMVKMEQIFLPYVISQDNRTLYEVMVNGQFQITQGKEDAKIKKEV